MSARAILLRVLLCVVLVFNGAASAMASVRMMELHAQADADAAEAQVDASAELAPPCHDEAQPPHHMDTAAPSNAKHPPTPDCCKSGTCTCACVSPVIAMVPVLALHAVASADAGNVRPMALGHAAPVLPHLIRPPIG